MDNLSKVYLMYNNLSIYGDLKKDKGFESFEKCLKSIVEGDFDLPGVINNYSAWCEEIFKSEHKGCFKDYVFEKILYSENIFANYCALNKYFEIPKCIKSATETDLHNLGLIANISSDEIKNAIKEKCGCDEEIINMLPNIEASHRKYKTKDNWSDLMVELAQWHKQNGVGVFAKSKAFIYKTEQGLLPVTQTDPIRLKDLKLYEFQKEQIVNNTKAFIDGKPANNVLLYGDRGTGKSSTVKALLNEFAPQGLRIVQIAKEDLKTLDRLIEMLNNVPNKFIVFIDDLTFNESEDSFGMLKAMLEGSLVNRPSNMLIYATSNRRHLIKETFQAREGDEVHRSDTIDENLSLSDRFGLCITFVKPTKDKYLEIVFAIAQDRKLQVSFEELAQKAETFAVRKNGRSPRVAKQFVDYLQSTMN